MAGDYLFREFSESQRQTYRSLVAAYQAYREAWQQLRVHQGGMHWKKIGGSQYLYRYRDRYGHGGSLGRRAPQTEQLFADFTRERQESRARSRERWRQLAEQARFCRAALLPRLPGPTAKILRRLEEHESGVQLRVIGSAALYAYAFAAGVFLAGATTRTSGERLASASPWPGRCPRTTCCGCCAGRTVPLLSCREPTAGRLTGTASRCACLKVG